MHLHTNAALNTVYAVVFIAKYYIPGNVRLNGMVIGCEVLSILPACFLIDFNFASLSSLNFGLIL